MLNVLRNAIIAVVLALLAFALVWEAFAGGEYEAASKVSIAGGGLFLFGGGAVAAAWSAITQFTERRDRAEREFAKNMGNLLR